MRSGEFSSASSLWQPSDLKPSVALHDIFIKGTCRVADVSLILSVFIKINAN